MVFKRTKRHFIIDVGVIVIILIAVAAFGLLNRNKLLGWDINGRTERLENEEREVDENVYVRNGGELFLDDSTLAIASDYDGQHGIFVNGKSRLEVNVYRLLSPFESITS